MSVDVRNFLDNSGGNNFTDNAPRLPPQGEENERHSTGGHSAKSSGSHKSQHSGKSLASNKAVSYSPSARKCHSLAEDQALERGEAQGSAAQTPPFAENNTPPFGRWTESLECLLEDAEGVRLFKDYLDQLQSSNLFDFYFAWKYLNELDASDLKAIKSLIKTMFKVFIKGDKGDKKLLTIRTEFKEAIVKRMADKAFQQDIYDQVKEEVMDRLKRHYYPAFLKSEVCAQYVATIGTGGDSIAGGDGGSNKSSSSSGSNSARPLSAAVLPTLHEDRELDLKTMPVSDSGSTPAAAAPVALPLTQDAIRLTERLRQDCRIAPEEHTSLYVQQQEAQVAVAAPNPYHTMYGSYLPISAIDSERQSLSSEALTDDTLSVTDSSVDGYPTFSNKKSLKRYHLKLSKIAQRNPDAHLPTYNFQPRTERMTKVSNLAESDPAKFAEILSQRLQAILDDDKRNEMIQSRLNAISEGEDTDDNRSLLSSTTAGGSTSGHHHASSLNQLLLAMQQSAVASGARGVATGNDEDGEAQDILDLHCQRIWEESGPHSPTKSPPPLDPHGSARLDPHGSARLDPHGSSRLDPHGSSRLDPHGSSRLDPHGSSRLDPHGSARLDPHGSARRMATLPRSTVAGSVGARAVSVMPPPPVPMVVRSSGTRHGIAPATAYFVPDQATISTVAVPAAPLLFQRELDGHVRQIHNHHYGGVDVHYMAAQPPTPAQQQQVSAALRQPARPLHAATQFVPNAAGSAFKPMPLVVQQQQQQLATSSQSKVMEWISRNEEITQSSTAHYSDSEKASSHKRSHKSGSTTASPRQNRLKSHSKKLPPYASVGEQQVAHATLVASINSSSVVMPALAAVARSTVEEAAKKLDEKHASTAVGVAGLKLRSTALASGGNGAVSGKERKATTRGTPEPAVSSAFGGQKSASSLAATAALMAAQPQQLRVAYYLNDQPIPYSTTVPAYDITLLKFKELIKELIMKKGTYRYFFKKANEDEFGSDVTHFLEEITQDYVILPKWEGKVIGYVKKVD